MPARPSSGRHRADQSIVHWHTPGAESLTVVEGAGATVVDDEGEEYLDFISQLYCVNAGHDEERIIEAIERQLDRIPYVSPAKRNDVREALARRLIEVAPGTMADVFFAISGSEANEAAIQFAREYMDAPTVLTRWRSYHGTTYGTASLTGDPAARTPVQRYAATTGATKFLPPMVHRSPFPGPTPADVADQAAEHLEFVIRNEGPDSIAAVLMEPIGGTSGAYPPPPGYLERARELCDEYDVLLIADEVITGFGRCGEWFGMQTEGVEPDMLTFAKAATSAYVPLSGVLVREEMASWIREEGTHLGQTFAGHPVACAAALAALDVYEDGLIDNVRSLAPHFEDELDGLRRHEAVGSVHGRGFLWSVEFTDPETGEPFMDPRIDEGENPVRAVREHAQREGVLLGSGRPDIQVLLAPPLCVDEAAIDRAVSVLDDAIETVFGPTG